MPHKAKKAQSERYDLARSPLCQKPTQRDIGKLTGESRDDLRRLVNYKQQFIVRRQIVAAKGKTRDLAYPVTRLRAFHERMKFHLNKIKQPDYLFSPRKNKCQRDNAEGHLNQRQYLTLDLRQFYPSTSDEMVRRWFRNELGMYDDVAGLLTHLCTVDGKVAFGSPLTPVLCTLIHRRMFDEIAEICRIRGLNYSVWVDDLTISGSFVPREVLAEIRNVIRRHGLKSHRIKYRTGNRAVFITGVGVVGANLVAPNTLNLKIRGAWSDYHEAVTTDEKDIAAQKLLSLLGTIRHISGPKSVMGRKAADEMNSLRQKRDARRKRREAELRIELAQRPKLSAEEQANAPF